MKELLSGIVEFVSEVSKGFQSTAIVLVVVFHKLLGLELLPAIFVGITVAVLLSILNIIGQYISSVLGATMPKIAEAHAEKLTEVIKNMTVKKFLILLSSFAIISIAAIVTILVMVV